MNRSRSLLVTTLLAVSSIATACATDSADSVGSVETSQGAAPTRTFDDLLIDPTTDVEASGRPVVLWFWAPG